MALVNTILSVVDLIRRSSSPIREAVISSSSSSSSSSSQVDGDLEKLAASLSSVLPILDRAEESEDAHVKLWLGELRCVAYDAEDVLDEFQFDMLRRRAEGGAAGAHNSKRKRHTSGAAPSPPPSYADRIRKIRERLDVIQKERDAFSLGDAEGSRLPGTMPLSRPPSAARVDESRLFGREDDVEKVVDMLLHDEDDEDQSGRKNFFVVSIVGMPGLGKTTLAKMVYQDERVSNTFETRSWVHVSEKFDPARIMRSILERMTRRSMKHVEMNLLQELLKKELAEKRFLLLLDDIWCEDTRQWEAFKVLLTCGARGSRVLITTRMQTVAENLGSKIHLLDVLSQGDCWSLFSHYAFGGQSTLDANPSLVEIGREIVTVKALGGLLSYETDVGRWEKVLASEIREVSEGKRCILPGLKLSYSLLPSSMKQCFSYCAVIPKARSFERDQLVRMWIGQGFLGPQDEACLEDVANGYFDNLILRSFFQPSEHYWDDTEEDEEMFVMHDLIHDMVKNISTDECSVIEEGSMSTISTNARHSSVICTNTRTLKKFQANCPQSLRTFLLMNMEAELNTQLLGELFLRLTCLRVLDLSFANISELPASIGSMKHLRYLGLQGTKITGLPESIGGLYNLQTLDSRHCELLRLPKSLGNLANLRHLVHQNYDFTTTSLSMMPRGIGKLTCLKTLPIFVVSRHTESASLGELKDLNDLRGALFIVRLYKASNGAVSAKEANLKGKRHLETLCLEWGEGPEAMSPSICKGDEKLLENLEPPTNLKELHLYYNYRGFRFPKWMEDPSFSNLETVLISGCINCKHLPPLGQLPSLKFLSIGELNAVQHVGREFLGEGRMRGFPSLMALNFRDMPEWKEWGTEFVEDGDFPLLRNLTVEKCPKLESLSLHNLMALQELTIKNCAELTLVDCLNCCCMAGMQRELAHSSSLRHLEFRQCPKLEFSSQEWLPSTLQQFHVHRCQLMKEWSQSHSSMLQNIPDLQVTGEEISIHDIFTRGRAIAEELKLEEGLKKLELGWYLGIVDNEDKPEDVLDDLKPHTNLKELTIDGYRGLSFTAWVGDPSFSNLVKMTLTNCTECTSLPALGKLTSLKELQISILPQVQSIGHEFCDGGFPSLESLQIQDMARLKEWKVTVEGAFPCLVDLTICRCPKLSELASALTKIKSQFKLILQQFNDVMVFKELQSIHTCITLCISRFPNLRELPHQFLSRNLKELQLEGCNRLKALSHLPPWITGLVLTTCNVKILQSSRSFSPFISLTYLSICRFPSLKTLPVCNLPALEELCISSCPELVSLCCPSLSSMLPSLRVMSIKDCPMLEFSPEEQLPTKLECINISGCHFLAEWCRKQWSEISYINKLLIDGILVSTCDGQHAGEKHSSE